MDTEEGGCEKFGCTGDMDMVENGGGAARHKERNEVVLQRRW